MSTQREKRLAALEQRAAPQAIFVQFAHERPAQPRYVAAGQPVDAPTFTQQLARAGRAVVLIRVEYGEA